MNCEVNTCRNAGSSRPPAEPASSTWRPRHADLVPARWPGEPALGVTAVQHQRRPAPGAAPRTRPRRGRPGEIPSRSNASRPGASTTVSRSLTQLSKVAGPRDVPGRTARSRVRRTGPAGVARQLDQPMPPHRAVPVVVEVGEPVRGFHQRRPCRRRGVGDRHAVHASGRPGSPAQFGSLSRATVTSPRMTSEWSAPPRSFAPAGPAGQRQFPARSARSIRSN